MPTLKVCADIAMLVRGEEEWAEPTTIEAVTRELRVTKLEEVGANPYAVDKERANRPLMAVLNFMLRGEICLERLGYCPEECW